MDKVNCHDHLYSQYVNRMLKDEGALKEKEAFATKFILTTPFIRSGVLIVILLKTVKGLNMRCTDAKQTLPHQFL